MVSAIDQVTAKLGEKNDVQAESIESSLQQQLGTTKAFALEALRRESLIKASGPLVEYESIIRLVEALRHHNPNCLKTTAFYINTVRLACQLLGKTPDELASEAASMAEAELQGLLMRLDRAWINDLNSPHTRVQKWAMVRKFFYANGVFKAKVVKPNIAVYNEVNDRALTCEDCRRILDACRNTRDKVVVSLLIESLQRIGTITQLIWADVLPHIEAGEKLFLIWIDAKRTKRNISHWMPVGKLSSYYMGKLLSELDHTQFSESAQLVSKNQFRNIHAVERHISEIMVRAGVRGKKQGEGNSTRYEKHIHSFRKFGVVEMQRQGVNDQVIRFLMGQKRDTYSDWTDRYDELLEICRSSLPTLDKKDTIQEVVDFAASRGFSFDPEAFAKFIGGHGKVGADQGHSAGS